MIFTAVQQNILRNELVIFGKTDKSDITIQDTDYVAEMNRVLFDDPMDLIIKFNPEIGNPITVSVSKISDEFYVLYQNTDHIDLTETELFVQEAINRRIELDRGKAEVHGKSLA